MTVTLTGTIQGRKVKATKSGSRIKGDASLLNMARDDIALGKVVSPHPMLPVVTASFQSDIDFAVTIAAVLDPGTHGIVGMDLPKVPKDTRV